MQIERFTLNPIGTNTYVVGVIGGEAMIVDPGATELAPVIEYVRENRMTVKVIVNTHGHFDHVLGNEEARRRFAAPLYIHQADLPVLLRAPMQAQQWFGLTAQVREPDRFLADGDVLEVAGARFVVIETPGHSPGSICLYDEGHQMLLSGDTLFAGTVGRTDLPGSNPDALVASLREQLWPLPDAVRIYPGHEEDSTIGEERMYNPFFHFVE